MENITDFDFYLKFTKPLVLNLPKIDDRVLAAAWVKKLTGDSGSDEKIKLDYLKLLLFVLQRKRLAPPFTQHPNSVQTLEKFPQNQTLVDVAKKIIEGEQDENREKYRKRRLGQSGDYPPYISDFSADLLEYVAVQKIENFGTHAYYAISKLPLQTWYRVDKQLLPKAAKSMLEVSTPPPTLAAAQSTPDLFEKPPEEPPTTSTEPPSEPEPPKEEPPKKKKDTKRSSLGATPPSRPIGKLSPPPEDRAPPSWGSNLLEAKFLEGEVEETAPPTEESFRPPASSTMASVETIYKKKPAKKPFPKARPTRASLLAQKKKQAEPPPPPPKKKKSKSKIGKPKIVVPEVIEEEEPPPKATKAIKGKKKAAQEEDDAFLDEYDAMLKQMEAEAMADLQEFYDQNPDVEPIPDDQIPSFEEDTMAAHFAALEHEAMDDLKQFEEEHDLAPIELSPQRVASPQAPPLAKKVRKIPTPKGVGRPPAAPPRTPTPPRRSPTPSPPPRRTPSPSPPRRSPSPSPFSRSPSPSLSLSPQLSEPSIEEEPEDVVDPFMDEYDAMLDQWQAEAEKDLQDFMEENPELELLPDDQVPSLDVTMDDFQESMSEIAKSSQSPLPKSHDVAVDHDVSIHLSPEAREIYENLMQSAGMEDVGSPIRHPTPRLTHHEVQIEEEEEEEKERGSPKTPLPEPASTKSSPGHKGKDPRVVDAFNEMLNKTRQLSPTVEDDYYELMERMIEEDMRRTGVDPSAREKPIPFPSKRRKTQRKAFLDFHHKADAQLESLAEEETAEFYQTAPEDDDFEAMERLIETQMTREGFDPHSRPPDRRLTQREFIKEKEKQLALQEKIDQQMDELGETAPMSPYEDLQDLGLLEEEELEAFSPTQRRLEDMKHIYHDWLTSAPALEGVPVVVPHHTIDPRRRRFDPKDFPGLEEKPDFNEYEYDIDWSTWYPSPEPQKRPPTDPRSAIPPSPPHFEEEFTEIPQTPSQVWAKYPPEYFQDKYEEPEIKYEELRPVATVEGEVSPKRPQEHYKKLQPPSYYDELFKTIVPDEMGEETPPGYLASPVSPPDSPPIDLMGLKRKIALATKEARTPTETRRVAMRRERLGDKGAPGRLSTIYPGGPQPRTYSRAPDTKRIPQIPERAEPPEEKREAPYFHITPEKTIPDVFDLPDTYNIEAMETPPPSIFGQPDLSSPEVVTPEMFQLRVDLLGEKPQPHRTFTVTADPEVMKLRGRKPGSDMAPIMGRKHEPRLATISNVIEEQGGAEEWEQYGDILGKGRGFDFVTGEQFKQRRQRRVPGTPPPEDAGEIEAWKRGRGRLPAIGSPVDYPPSPLTRRPAPESPGREGPRRRTLRRRLKKRKLDFTEPQSDPDESHKEVTEVTTEVVDDEERELFMDNEEVDELLAGVVLPREMELEMWQQWFYGPKGPPKSPKTPERDLIDVVEAPFGDEELPEFSPMSPLRQLGVIEETMAKAKAAPIYDVRRYRDVHPPRVKPRILPRLVEDVAEEQAAIFEGRIEDEIEAELEKYKELEEKQRIVEEAEAYDRLTYLDEPVPANLPSPMTPPIVHPQRRPRTRREATPAHHLPRPIRDILETEEMPDLVSPKTPDLWVPGATPPSPPTTPFSPKITELVVDEATGGLDEELFPTYQTPPRTPRSGIHFRKLTPEPRRHPRGSPEVEALFQLPEYQNQPRAILRKYADWQECARTARSLEEVEARMMFPDVRYESMVDPVTLGHFEANERRKEAERARAEAEARAERQRKAEEAAAKAKTKAKTIKGKTSKTQFEYKQTTREKAKKEKVVSKTPSRRTVQKEAEPPRLKQVDRVTARTQRSRPWVEAKKVISKEFGGGPSRGSLQAPSTSRAKSAPEKASRRPSSTSVKKPITKAPPEPRPDRAAARTSRSRPWAERPSQTSVRSATSRQSVSVRSAPSRQSVDRSAARESRARPWAEGPKRPPRGGPQPSTSTQSVKSRTAEVRSLRSKMDRAKVRYNRMQKEADKYATTVTTVATPRVARPPPGRGTARATRVRPWTEAPPKAPPRQGPRPPPRGPFRKPPPPIQGPKRKKIQAVSKIDTGRRRPTQVEYDVGALQDLGLTVRDLQEMYLDDEGMLGYEPSFEIRGPFDESSRYLGGDEGGYMIEDMASRGYEEEWEDMGAEFGYESDVSLPEYQTQLEMEEYYDEEQGEVTKTLTIARKPVTNQNDYNGHVTVLTVEASM
ncbi:titin-like [Tribolium madens]|uniref:titin-like n=1 Tax=Tribolium madens TaxID=41895 RepID=UPI001CF72771|nr:titin-like [Tribolium madens]